MLISGLKGLKLILIFKLHALYEILECALMAYYFHPLITFLSLSQILCTLNGNFI